MLQERIIYLKLFYSEIFRQMNKSIIDMRKQNSWETDNIKFN